MNVNDCLEQFALLDVTEARLKSLMAIICHYTIATQLEVDIVLLHLTLW